MKRSLLIAMAAGFAGLSLAAPVAGAGMSPAEAAQRSAMLRVEAPRIELDATIAPDRIASRDAASVLTAASSLRIGELIPGDLVRITDADRVSEDYRVAEIRILHAEEALISPTMGDRGLVLVSDLPEDPMLPGSPLRYVVFAEADSVSVPPLAFR